MTIAGKRYSSGTAAALRSDVSPAPEGRGGRLLACRDQSGKVALFALSGVAYSQGTRLEQVVVEAERVDLEAVEGLVGDEPPRLAEVARGDRRHHHNVAARVEVAQFCRFDRPFMVAVRV